LKKHLFGKIWKGAFFIPVVLACEGARRRTRTNNGSPVRVFLLAATAGLMRYSQTDQQYRKNSHHLGTLSNMVSTSVEIFQDMKLTLPSGSKP
jgi:hypothetical protein